MRATVMHSAGDVRIEDVPDPSIVEPSDAVVRVTRGCICGSDLWPYASMEPSESGQSMGHEAIGVVEEVGADVGTVKRGDVVVMPFAFSDGTCAFCHEGLHTACVHVGFFGNNGMNGAQAEALRVPYADVGPLKIPDGLDDEQVLFLSDIFPTGFMAAEFCDIQDGDTIAIWGCGPVGQFAIRSAFLLGAERVIAIDTVPERLALARASGAETIDFKEEDVYDRMQALTQGRGADAG